MRKGLCERCAFVREIVTPKGSRFLLCQLSQTNAVYPKYPSPAGGSVSRVSGQGE